MEKLIKLLQDWLGHKSGTTLGIPEDVYNDWKEKGCKFEDVQATEPESKGISADEMTAIATSVAKSVVEEITSEDHVIGKKLFNINTGADNPAGPYKSLGEQLQDVAKAENNDEEAIKRLKSVKAPSGFNTIEGADGGFMVQTDQQAGVMTKMFERSVLAPLCSTIELTGEANSLAWKELKEDSRANGSRRGGLQVYRTEESGSATATQADLRERSLKAEKMTGLYYATEEQLADAGALEGMVDEWLADEFGFKIDDEIYRGTGVGQMQGILNADCLVTVDKETGQDATTIVSANLEKMFSRIWPRSLASARFFMNQNCWPQIFQLNHEVGTGGQPMFMRPGAISEAPAGMLLGRPISVIEHAESVGTVGDIVLADFSQYRIISKGQMTKQTSIHVRFVQGETAFRFVVRNNGVPLWTSALTPYKGTSETQSPFVALQTRS